MPGILETGAEDYMMSQFGDQPGESFLEADARLWHMMGSKIQGESKASMMGYGFDGYSN